MTSLTLSQWIMAAMAAFLLGFSKTGVPGIGGLGIAIFANLPFSAFESTGVVLPLLVCGDVIAVASYHRHVIWPHLIRLLPWVMVGIGAGYLTMQRISGARALSMIGAILIFMVLIQVWRKQKRAGNEVSATARKPWFAAVLGMLAGFTTMLANAGGPVMILYMLAMKLGKNEFLGTGAWYFLILNVTKLPLNWKLGILNAPSLLLDLRLVSCVILGAILGRIVMPRINQKLFENLALFFTLIGAIRLFGI